LSKNFVDDGELDIDLEIWPRHIGWGAGMGIPWARMIFNLDQPSKYGNSAPSPAGVVDFGSEVVAL
jgi:hypothetical protein